MSAPSVLEQPLAAGRRRPRRAAPRRAGWLALAAAIAALTAAPVAFALAAFLVPTGDVWAHLTAHVLPQVLVNTLWLVGGVGVLTALVGTTLAWLVTACEFPGRRFFRLALLLPLAVPGYVLAFALLGLFEYAGPLQSFLRATVSPALELPGLGSRGASVVTLSLVLYPYVYLIARQAFATQGVRALEVAQSLGLTARQGFLRVALPMARPWIAAGVALAAMETLADFGTVKVFNYDTFTTAIFEAWYGLFSLEAALQLAVILVALVVLALLAERRFRGRARYAAAGGPRTPRRLALSRGKAWLATAYASVIFAVAFVLPMLQLLVWGASRVAAEVDERYLAFAGRSLMLSALAAVIVTALAVFLAYAVRQAGNGAAAGLARLATLGYAIPGAVLAVGFFAAVATLGRLLEGLAAALPGGGSPEIVLTGTLLALLLAYAVRFLAVAHGPVDSALARVTANVEDAARGMGVAGWRLLGRVHLPLLKPGLATAALLVFVDVMKELPITLMTRPFGWDTLAVRVYQMTMEGEWERAALPALAIVVAGLAPLALLDRRSG